MGYSTDLDGELKFNRILTADELAFIKSMFWLECDDYEKEGWIHPKGKPHYIQIEFTDDFSGIKWDGSEKFYEAVAAINFIIANARTKIKDFTLSGQLEAHGEEHGDHWFLVIGDDGWAEAIDAPKVGEKVKCPHCRKEFVLEATEET